MWGHWLTGATALLGCFLDPRNHSHGSIYKIVWLVGSAFRARFIEPKIFVLRHVLPCVLSKTAKRRDLSLGKKVDLFDKIALQPPGMNHRRLSDISAVPKSTIGRLVCNESELHQQLLEECAQRIKSTIKQKRSGKDAEVEEALNQWLNAALAKAKKFAQR